MSAIVASINRGTVVETGWGRLKRSGIDKRPVEGPVTITPLGVEGDGIADVKYHGGHDQALYAFAGEDVDHWAKHWDRDLPPGTFGENLTTRGIDLNEVRLGERWQIGSTVVEVSSVRTPCATLAGFVGEKRVVKDFVEVGRPGAYLRVIQAGHIAAGDEITVLETRDHDITVGLMFRALTTEKKLLARLLEEPRVAAKERAKAEKATR
ncbi:MAG: hypothetical protein JWP10_1333 [Nocardioidaceae bacterium]|nr:hypothetical protein [Nocardioidaceae bacterium]